MAITRAHNVNSSLRLLDLLSKCMGFVSSANAQPESLPWQVAAMVSVSCWESTPGPVP